MEISSQSFFFFNSIPNLIIIIIINPNHSFETRPGPAGRPWTRPIRGRNRAGLMKKRGKEKPGVTRLTR
jgi:hypothetical protein